jgi:hypothetical protein
VTKPISSASKAAEWPTPQDVEYVFKAFGPPATEQGIRDILKIIDPPPPARTECLHAVLDIMRVIASATPFEPPGKVKKQFRAIETDTRKLRTKMMRLPDHQRRRFNAFDELVDSLGQFKEWCSDQAGSIQVRHSGGERTNSGKMVVAAVFASKLLQQFGGGYPAGERYYTFTGLLFEAVTGEERDCKNICVEVLRGQRRE